MNKEKNLQSICKVESSSEERIGKFTGEPFVYKNYINFSGFNIKCFLNDFLYFPLKYAKLILKTRILRSSHHASDRADKDHNAYIRKYNAYIRKYNAYIRK